MREDPFGRLFQGRDVLLAELELRQGVLGSRIAGHLGEQALQGLGRPLGIARLGAQLGKLQIGGRFLGGRLDGLLQGVLGQWQLVLHHMGLGEQAQGRHGGRVIPQQGAQVADGLVGIVALQGNRRPHQQGVGALAVLREDFLGQGQGLIRFVLGKQQGREPAARLQPVRRLAVAVDHGPIGRRHRVVLLGVAIAVRQREPQGIVVGPRLDQLLELDRCGFGALARQRGSPPA